MSKIICTQCKTEFHTHESGVFVIEMASFGPYKVWSAYLMKCRGCGTEIVAGFGQNPLREDHYKPDFPAWLDNLIANCKEHNVSVIYDYERPQEIVHT